MFRTLWGAAFFLGLGTAAAGELTGTITQVSMAAASVKLRGPGMSEFPAAAPWQVIRSGVVLEVPDEVTVGVVCSTGQFVRIPGRASWRLDGRSCAAGTMLKVSEYALVAPQGGRLKSIRGFMVLQKEMRGEEDPDPLAPIVLSPRNTAIRSPRPSLRWLQVPSAAEYRIKWSGRGGNAFTRQLDADDLACETDPAGHGICEMPWPEDRPDLPPSRTFFLSVAARGGVADPWHELDAVKVRTLAVEDAASLKQRLRSLEEVGLGQVAQANALAESGLYEEALGIYQRAVEDTPAAVLRISLADLYLTIGLPRLADPLYRQVLEHRDPAIRAAAAFGLGRTEYARARYREAAAQFRQSGQLYKELRLREEKIAALQAGEQAEKRIRK